MLCCVAPTVTGWDDLARSSAGSDAAGGIRAILVKPHSTQDGTVGRAPLRLGGAGGGGADWGGVETGLVVSRQKWWWSRPRCCRVRTGSTQGQSDTDSPCWPTLALRLITLSCTFQGGCDRVLHHGRVLLHLAVRVRARVRVSAQAGTPASCTWARAGQLLLLPAIWPAVSSYFHAAITYVLRPPRKSVHVAR